MEQLNLLEIATANLPSEDEGRLRLRNSPIPESTLEGTETPPSVPSLSEE